jgi:hypothetical protein
MAEYTATGDPNIINKTFTGTTQIDIERYVERYLEIKQDYQNNIAATKADAGKLYAELKPIYDGGLLPSGYTTQYNQLETFVTT